MSDEKEVELRSYVLSVILENQPGALARVVGLFSGRAYNIQSLGVAEINSQVSRITIVCPAPAESRMVIDQIMAQIAKLVPVIRVRDLTDDPDRFDLEFTLLRVDVSGPKQEEAVLVAHQFGAVLRRTKPDSLFFLYEKPGLEAFQEIAAALGKLGNVAVARTGLVALGGRKSQGPQVP